MVSRRFSVVIPVLISVIAAMLALSACGPRLRDDLAITDVGWVIENIDNDYWASSTSTTTLSIRFNIFIDCEDFDPSALRILMIHSDNQDGTWNLELTEDDFNEQYGTISRRLSGYAPGYTIPIGPYQFTLRTEGFTDVLFEKNVPAPGRSISFGDTVAYNEDYTGTIYQGYTPTIRRGSMESIAKDSDSLSLRFSGYDTLCFNGYLIFFSAVGDYVGSSPYFRQYGTGAISSFVNSGSNFYSSGTSNQVDLRFEDISFPYSSYDADDIAQVALALTDGAQYMGTSETYDCISITDQATVQ